MTVKEIFDNYNKERTEADAKEKNIKEKIARLERKLDKIYKSYPTRTKRFVVPLAEALKEATGLPFYEIYGPFGLDCETSIYLSRFGKQGSIPICEVETYSLTLKWKPDGTPLYWTGKKTEEYPEGSIGYYNGFNNIYAELPNEISEVVKVLRHSEKGDE